MNSRFAPLWLSLVVPLLLLAGCSLFGLDGGSADATRTTSMGPITLAEGDRVFLSDVNTRVKFVAKTDDNRCPLDVLCIWAGKVTVVLEVTRGNDAPVTVTLTGYVGPEGDRTVTADAMGLRFTLQRVDPYPQIDVLPPESSTIRLLVVPSE